MLSPNICRDDQPDLTSAASTKMDLSDFALNRLSDSVLIEILARLPCKSAIRFKLVCKRWNSLISSDYFVSLLNHMLHNSPDPSSYKLLVQLRPEFRGTEYEHTLLVPDLSDTNRVVQRLDLGFLPCRPVSRIAVRASCADLILCSFEENLYVCNPRTEQWVALPPAPTRMDDYVAGLLCIPAPCSICHTEAADSSRYKFVVMRIRSYDSSVTQLEVEQFSSEEGQWRNHLVSSPQIVPNHRRRSIVPYKGLLHWLSGPRVLVFDPFNAPGKISRVIDVERDIARCIIHDIGVWSGRLCVSCTTVYYSHDSHHYIWELEDDEMGKWSLVHKLNPADLYLYGLFVHPDGNVLFSNGSSLWLCNILTAEEVKDLKFDEIVHGGHGLNVHHIEDKWWPTPVPSLSL